MEERTEYRSRGNELQIDLDSLVRDLLKQWWVILLAAVSAALLTGAYKMVTYTPQYTASTTFAVGISGFSSNLAYDNLRSAEEVTARFSQVADSSVLKKRVCEELGLDSFSAEVSVSVVPSSNLMTMTVTADSPELAWRMIHSIMENTMELTEELMDSVAVKVLKAPSVPTAPKQALNPREAMKKAVVIAFAAMAALFALLSYFKDTVKNASSAVRKLDAKLLGVICHEKKDRTLREKLRLKKKKTSILIDDPAVSFSYVESVRMAAAKIRSAMDRREAKVLMVTSVSENEGKSTVAANLALAMVQEERSVVLIDCDFRKPSQYKIFEIPEERQKESDFMAQLQGNEPIRISKVGADRKLGLMCCVESQQNLLNQGVGVRLKNVMETLKKRVDYIILDTSPLALVADGEALAEMADASILVVQQDMMEARYINDALDQLGRTKSKVLGCVLNNVRTGFFSRSQSSGYYYGGYGYGSRYGKYGSDSRYDTKRSENGKQGTDHD